MTIVFTAGMKLTPSRLNSLPKGVITRARRDSNSTASTGAVVGVLRIDDVPVTAGRLYHIYTGSLAPDSTVANDIIRSTIRFTTDGSTPTTASTQIPGAITQQRQDDASQSENTSILVKYAPGSDQTLSLLLCVQRVSGTGSCVLLGDGTTNTIELVIEDIGVDPGDTGTDV